MKPADSNIHFNDLQVSVASRQTAFLRVELKSFHDRAIIDNLASLQPVSQDSRDSRDASKLMNHEEVDVCS